jgi:hypothetical protein
MPKNFAKTILDARNIANNPGRTVEELQEQVKKLAQAIQDIARFLDDDLAGHILHEIDRKNRFRSS